MECEYRACRFSFMVHRDAPTMTGHGGHRTATNRSNPTGWIKAWKKILNPLTIHYGDRTTAAN